MAKQKIDAPPLLEIVFEKRNKDYGAYVLRRKYPRTLILAMIIGVVGFSTGVITPYLNAKALEGRQEREERVVEIQMENLDQPTEAVAPPPPPPPPPAEEAVQQSRYVPPVVVDTIKPEEATQLMTADDARVEIVDDEVTEEIAVIEMEEIQEEEPEPEPFVVVEEMPMFPGGETALLQYISENTIYPEVAKENNIQGRVIVRFCVNSTGGVSQISVLKGVDPELDEEAIRVVSTLPKFKPGKQGGKPVPVWYMVPITFTLK